MRVDKFELLRYGKFTDQFIDFGEAKGDQPDLHIIYGPNEAGKSTLMAAYLDFLFGFPTKTKYSFKHANTVLKLGAALTIDNDSYEFRRLKKNKNSLVDMQDQAISDAVLENRLSGLSKDSYSSMFSLDDETLEKGGESILASQGDLGKLLYSATTGVAQLSESLMELRSENAKFYEKGKRKLVLTDLKNQLKEVEAQRKQLDTEAAGYSKLVKTYEEAEKHYDTLGAERDQLKLAIKQLETKLNAYPRVTAWQRIQTELLPLAQLPDPPSVWFEEARERQNESVKIETRASDIEKTIKALDESIAGIDRDTAALAVKDQWEQLESARVNYQMARSNLTELQLEKRVSDKDIASCLEKLDKSQVENPGELLLSTTVQTKLRELIGQHAPLNSELVTAKTEVNNASEQYTINLNEYRSEGGQIDEDENVASASESRDAIEALELEVASHNVSELFAQQQSLTEQIDSYSDSLSVSISSLSPWSGDGPDLQALNVPHDSELELLKQRRESVKTRLSEQEQLLQIEQKKLNEYQAQQKGFNATGLVNDAQTLALRQERDKAWLAHRKSMDVSSADVFESAMRLDDTNQAARLQHTESVVQMAHLSREIITADESIKNINDQLKQLNAERENVDRDVATLIQSISPALNSTMTLDALAAWLEERSNALELLKNQTRCARELENIAKKINQASESVAQALSNAGMSPNNAADTQAGNTHLTQLLKQAQAAVKREAILAGMRKTLAASQHQLQSRNATLASAEQALADWQSEWQSVCAQCWIGMGEEVQSVAVVTQLLDQLVILEQCLKTASELQEKITQNESSIAVYDQALKTLCQNLSIEVGEKPLDNLAKELGERMSQSLESETKLNALLARKEDHVEKQKANEEVRAVNSEAVKRMLEFFSVGTINEVEIKLQEVKAKQQLQERASLVRDEVLGMLDLNVVEEAVTALSGFDSDASLLSLEELNRKSTDIENQLQQAHTDKDQARIAIESVGGDDAVAQLAEQKENILLELQEQSTQYLQKRLALIAADAALKTYRDNHRSTMMQVASETFSKISKGRYPRLETMQDGGLEKLIAIDEQGQAKESGDLSKGTRFQLYLALRVAGYHEYARKKETVPFIADDIMETSDDERAASTFEVLGEMAMKGQVIYLTHHRHLCDIAKNVVPGTKVHELS